SATSPQLASPFPLKSRRRSQSVTVEAIQAALGSATSAPTQPSRTARPVIAEETSPRHDGPALPAVTAAKRLGPDNPTERSFLLVNRVHRPVPASTNCRARRGIKTGSAFFGKWKVDRERMDNESLMPELAEKSAQLLRLEHSYEKLKAEQSKKDDLLKQKDAELLRRLKQIRALEEKGLKVDELTAEVARLREHTAQLQKQLRDKDFELKQSVQLQHNAETEAEIAKQAGAQVRDRVAGLTDQLRFGGGALRRTGRTAGRMRRGGEQTSWWKRIAKLAQQRRDADLLTSAARRAQRRLADELAAAKAECQRLRGLLEELGHSANVAVVKTEDASVGNRGNKATEEEASQSSNGREMNSRCTDSIDRERDGSFSQRRRSEGGGRRGSSRASRQLRERLVELHIHLGDRVALRPSKTGQQQLEAIVKYIGPLPVSEGVRYGVKTAEQDSASSSASVVSTDAAVFHSDLLLRAKQIEGVFSRKSLDSLISEYLEMH
uniref:PDZ domain-containing protein n=1 Tax=Macrostomum lignano TaxID=282301 RepID=A0A1I8FAP0_9PLAT